MNFLKNRIKMNKIKIQVSSKKHKIFAEEICQLIKESAKARKTGIAKKNPSYIMEKIQMGDSIIATLGDKLIGFCYIETFENKEYVVHSGLIVHHDYRNRGVGTDIKKKLFKLTKKKYPNSKLFGITTSYAVMKINADLGYVPVTFDLLTKDVIFWNGCQNCVNYDILKSKDFKNCLCTAMIHINKDKNIKKFINTIKDEK